MTIVVGYKDPATHEVWLGADSASTNGGYRFQTQEKKFFRVGHWWVGIAGTQRGAEIVAALDVIPEFQREPRAFVDQIFTAFDKHNFKKYDDRKTGAPSYGHQIILARAGELYEIGEDASISEPSWGFSAIGSGAAWAEGAAWIMHDENGLRRSEIFMPDTVVYGAVGAAINFRSDCGGEIAIKRVG